MRAKTVQVVWHGKEPVYSVDFHPDGTLFTAGADKEIKSWRIARGEDGYAGVTHVGTLTGHSRTVNCVRCSPSGGHLASGGDGGEMTLWAPADPGAEAPGALGAEEGLCTGWRRAAALRGHTDDVMDLSWAPDGSALLSGSIDNKAIVWGMAGKRRGQMVAQFANHKHFVQGVAWDPALRFVATQSADRTCRVYALRPPAAGRRAKASQHLQPPACDLAKELYCAHTLAKRVVSAPAAAGPDGAAPKPERQALFQDEAVLSFFRRLAWSPDGSFLAAPAGVHREAHSCRDINTAYIYASGHWAAPVAHLPAQNKPVVAVRFCPVLFRRDPAASPLPPFERLPYTMVFAVGTLDSVVVYDTTSPLPLAVLGSLHYDTITDLAWSRDGQYLAVASRDCYCSIAAFEPGELGTPAAAEDLPPHVAKRVDLSRPTAPAAAEGPPLELSRPIAAGGAAAPETAPAQVATNLDVAAVPGPAAAGPAQCHAEGGGAARRAEPIVPEQVRLPSGTVGGAHQADGPTGQPPAAKKHRITPELIQLPASASAAATAAAASAAAAAAAAGLRSVGNMGAGGEPAAQAAAAAKPGWSTAPGTSSGATKGPKRITPTYVGSPAGGGVQERFEHAKQAATPAPAELPREAGGAHRRITPVPLGPAQLLPTAVAPAAAAAPAKAMGVAALARAAGQQAAMAREGQT